MQELILRVQNGQIESNVSTFITNIHEARKKYQYIVDEENYNQAKDDKALINKTIDLISKNRISFEKQLLASFANDKKALMDIEKELKSDYESLNAGMGVFDQKEKDEKKALIADYFAELRFHLVPLEKLFDEKWLNKTASEKQWKEQLSAKVENINVELAIINNFTGTEEDKENIKAIYLETLNLSLAMQKHEAQQQAKERLKQAEEERQQAVKAEPSQTPREVEIVAPTVSYEPTTQDKPLLYRELWCEGTEDDIRAVGKFMNERGMRFGKLERN